MLKTLRNRNFTFVWIAGLVSVIGNYMLFVALPLYIYDLTKSTLATSIMFAAGIVPRLVVGPVAGVFTDRWDRKKIMVVANILMGFGLLPLLFVTSLETVWIIYLVQIFQSAVGQFLNPAEGALIPTLVEEKDLLSANALNSLNNNFARLIGPAVGALVVANFHLNGVVILDAASFFIAAGLVAFVHTPKRIVEATIRKTLNLRSAAGGVWHDLMEGVHLIRRDNTLLLLFVIATVPQIGEGIFSTLIAPFVTTVLGGHELDFGYILSAQAIGGLIGSVVIGGTLKRATLYRLLGFGAFFLGAIDFITFHYSAFIPGVWPAIVLMAIVGIPAVAYGMALNTMLQSATTDQYRGRILATIGTISALMALIGTILAGALGDKIGIVTVLNLDSLGFIGAGVLALVYFGRMAQTDTSTPAPAPETT